MTLVEWGSLIQSEYYGMGRNEGLSGTMKD